MNNKESREHALKELKHNLAIPIVSNERQDWVLDCLRVLNEDFCMTVSRGGVAHIELSPGRFSKLLETIGDESKVQDLWDLTDNLRKNIQEARIKCEAIIALHRGKADDEKKLLQERLDAEEEAKRRYRY